MRRVEPAVDIDGCGGLRHSSMVEVTQHGAEVLVPFQAREQELVRSAR